jgi:hypothetical protein
MLFKTNLLSAFAGVAMLALPAVALAAPQNHDFKYRPTAAHDNGWHNGWSKHDRERRDDDHFRGNVRFNDRQYPPMVRVASPPHTAYWHPVPYRPVPQPVYYPQPVRPYYPAPVANCPAPVASRWNYGPPISYYDSLPPAAYNPSQQVSWLLERRQQAYVVLAQMRARHDRDAANRMLGVINNLNGRIENLNRGTAYYNTPAVNYAPAPAPYAANPAAYNTYAGGYVPPYSNSPMLGVLGNVVGPMLGLPN